MRGLFLSEILLPISKTSNMRILLIPVLILAGICMQTTNSYSSTVVPLRDSLTSEQKTIARAAFDEFKNLPKTERKLKLREAKQKIKEFKAARRAGKETDTTTLLLVVLAILLPPLAVYLHEEEANTKFWITLLLFLLGIAGAVFFSWLLLFAAVVYALIVILGGA